MSTKRTIAVTAVCVVALCASTGVAVSKAPTGPSLDGHWIGTMQYATGGVGEDLIDVVIRGRGKRMTGTISYPGNPCHGPLRNAAWLGANRWRFRYIEQSHNLVACPTNSDHVTTIRFSTRLFVRDTTTKGARATGLLTLVP